MFAEQASAPGVPDDYYTRIYAAEEKHPWYRGMRAISKALVASALTAPGARILDAGCGTGGFLRWMQVVGRPSVIAGVDVGSNAIELARRRVSEAELHVAPLHELPFPDESFDLVVCNDVLQHVEERDVAASISELRRVMRTGGTLLLRTNGSRRLRRERPDWRAYDRATLVTELRAGGLTVERVTHANMLASLYGAARGRVPHAPSEERHGIPTALPGVGTRILLSASLHLEARFLSATRSALPYGHTLFAVARR